MNTQPQTTPPETALLPESQSRTTEKPKSKRRLRSKVAQLPKVLRDLVNTMLDDGVVYARIVEKLKESTDPPLPFPISEMNISTWKETGYQLHLAHKEHVAFVRMNREDALDMVEKDDTITLPEATLQIIASQYYELLADFSPEGLKEKLAEDPLKYIRFLNVFARLAREILVMRKHREDSAKAAADELKRLDPNRELSDREDEIITQRLDDFFHKPRRSPKPTEAPNPPPSPSGENRGERKPPVVAKPSQQSNSQ